MKKHLLTLLTLTVLIRGVMFISYPLGGQGESTTIYRYNVEQILAGDWQIGNLRYAPGFPLFMAPVSALGDLFGRFDDRIELLFQLTLASLIPFLLYDILRTRHSPKAAFIVAILSCIEPFSLMWAHFFTPGWWVALCLVLALWLLHHAERRRSWRLVVLAGLVTALGILGRWDYATVALGLAVLLLWLPSETFRTRLRNGFSFSASVLVLVFLVHFTIQVPATGVWNLSCISGNTLIEGAINAGLTLQVDNGPHSQRLLALIETEKSSPLDSPTVIKPAWFSDVFPFWQNPGTWLTQEERDAFLLSVPNEPRLRKTSGDINALASPLLFYLGPCETDRQLRAAFFETVLAEPLLWLLNIPVNMRQLLRPQLRFGTDTYYTLPSSDSLRFEKSGGILGFRQAFGSYDHFTGQWVWRPGIEIFSRLWAPLNALRFLVFPALIWALFTRHRVYTAIAFLLLLYVFVIGAIDYPEHRIYAIVYPLGPALVGGFLVALWERAQPAWQRLRTALAAARPD